MHLHAHPAKRNLAPGKEVLQAGIGVTSLTRSQRGVIQGDVKAALDF